MSEFFKIFTVSCKRLIFVFQEMSNKRKKKYKELKKRIEREKELSIVAQKMERKKQLTVSTENILKIGIY